VTGRPCRFGVELEFFLLADGGWPALGSTERVLELWRSEGRPPVLVAEYGSFQIELNPGPWPLSESGIAAALAETGELVDALADCAGRRGFRLSADALTPWISEELMAHPSFLAPGPRYRALFEHFARRQATLVFADGGSLVFPADLVTACLNELHLTVQLEDDERTLALFNHLHAVGEEPCRAFPRRYVVNGRAVAEGCTTVGLFAESAGEWDATGTLPRVGFLPFAIGSPEEYRELVGRFPPIVFAGEPAARPSDASVYFWVRLRGEPGDLRVEYRPMDMGADWPERLRHLARYALSFARRLDGGGEAIVRSSLKRKERAHVPADPAG
jgi:hypothetical protein